YKMSFHEPASRVPLIVAAPRSFAPHRVPESVSLADLLPTLLALADRDAQAGEAIAGRSLLPHLEGRGGHDEVVGEYLGEGALA
ncbi:hypothetical protein K3V39_14505, partial [Listeria monocytogenes]|nr:hypothetical protein [Listeria monocytogenes]